MRQPRPLRARPADPQPATPTEDSGGFHANVDWMMAVLLLGAAGLAVWKFEISWNFDFDSRDFSPIIFVPIFVGTYGLYHFVKALRGTLRSRQFGVSTLALHGGEVRMGAVLKGAIRIAVELRPLGDYVIRLQCIETFAMYRGGYETKAHLDHVRWQAEAKVPHVSANSKEGIPFEFTLPAPFEQPAAESRI